MGKVITRFYKFTTVILLCLISFSLSAQKLYFCKGYSETGEPKEVSENWIVDPNGTEVVLLYNNGKTTFDFGSLFFVIEKSGADKKTDKVEVTVAQSRNWGALKYTFKEPGYYGVSVIGKENRLLAKGLVKIGEEKPKEVVKEKEAVKEKEVVKEEEVKETPVKSETKEVIAETKQDNTISSEVAEVLYYDDLKVIFCEQLKEGKPVNEKSSFKIINEGAYVEIVLQSGKALNTNTITLDVWKKDVSANTYTEYSGDQEIKVDSKNKQVNFHHSFFKPGEYKISFFNAENTWMTSGYVSITQ